jgi:hypothetical protein
LFKKFDPRISPKTYLLNTINPFSDHENRSKGPKQQNLEKPLLGGYAKKPESPNSEYIQDIKSVQMTRVEKFQLSTSYGLGCRRGTNFCPRTVATAEAGVLTPGAFGPI